MLMGLTVNVPRRQDELLLRWLNVTVFCAWLGLGLIACMLLSQRDILGMKGVMPLLLNWRQ